MRYQQSFPTVVPQYKAGYPRVTHPSATNLHIARLQCKSVRLACVRHAASVHPEPGSNSHVKMVFVSCQFYLALFTVNSGSFLIFRLSCLFLNLAIHFSENLGIFRVALLFICQGSVCFVVVLFSAATLISYHNRFRLSTTFLNLFPLPENLRFHGGVLYYHIVSCFVNNFLHLFFQSLYTMMEMA